MTDTPTTHEFPDDRKGLLWRPGQTGAIDDLIVRAWQRYVEKYPQDQRPLEQAIPYVYVRSTCDRPLTPNEEWFQDMELTSQEEYYFDLAEQGREPEFAHYPLGHAHQHDHGICIHPDSAGFSNLARTLMHLLAHAISGSDSHGQNWHYWCSVIGYEPDKHEESYYQLGCARVIRPDLPAPEVSPYG